MRKSLALGDPTRSESGRRGYISDGQFRHLAPRDLEISEEQIENKDYYVLLSMNRRLRP